MAQLRLENGAERRDIALPAAGDMAFVVAAGKGGLPELLKQRPERYLAALLHAARHWVVLVPPGDGDVSIDGVPVPSLKILDDQSVLTVGGFTLRLAERVEEILAADAPLVRQAKSCPYCQQPFAANDVVIYCPTCGLAHHRTCLQLGKQCGSYPFCGYKLPKEEMAESAGARQ